MSVVLYNYCKSSSAYRVRIALNLKGIDYAIRTVNLRNNADEQRHADYLTLNPQGLVPTLVDKETVITQSSAIIEYLQDAYPNPSLLPERIVDRAYVRSLVQIIACDIQPLNNLRVLNYLNGVQNSKKITQSWYQHWIHEGFNALEQLLEMHHSNGQFCFANGFGMADAYLVPQVYNALRFQCDLKQFSLLQAIYENCITAPAFIKAAPENQPDYKVD